jgi:hypothetical protein
MGGKENLCLLTQKKHRRTTVNEEDTKRAAVGTVERTTGAMRYA